MVTRDPQRLLVSVAHILDKLGISYAITGGMSVVVWGRPRFTADIDVVIALTNQQVTGLASAFRTLGEGVYVDDEMIRNAYRRGGEFNIIDSISGVKVDFWVGKDEIARAQLARRVPQRISGVDVYFLSPEDLIVSKLIWFRKSESTRHLEDIESVLAISGDRVDRNYVNSQAGRLGLRDLWRKVSEKAVPTHAGSFVYSYAVIAEQGPRSRMEDCHIVVDKQKERGLLYCGIYDGHAGVDASVYAKDHVSEKFFERFGEGKTPLEAFHDVYETISKAVRDPHIGTCALDVVLTSDGTLLFASAGDSRLVVLGNESVKQLTDDHRASNIRERERIEQAGGAIRGRYIMKGAYGLEVTRSLGDEYFHDVGVIATPETGMYQLQENDQWLVAATDGLFDVLTNEEVAQTVRTSRDEHAALEVLKQKALVQKRTQDNVTIILVWISRQ